MEEHEKLEMEDLKSKLEAILKVQKEENDQAKFHTNSNTANRSDFRLVFFSLIRLSKIE
jgi:hypothetical protein